MEDSLSSPDPLNDSLTFHSPVKTRRNSKARSSLQPRDSSPTKQTFELDVGDRLSPQKIRVTVEAGSDKENGFRHYVEGAQISDISPSRPRVNRRREKTITTKVPVKGLSDSEDGEEGAMKPKRGRGRPRKSTGTPVPANKSGRAGTPTRRRKSIGDLVGGDDEEDLDFRIGKDVQVGRGKGRSRSRSTKAISRKSTPATKQMDDGASSSTNREGLGRSKSLLPQRTMVFEDGNAEDTHGSENFAENEGILPGMNENENENENEGYTLSAYSTIRSTNTIGVRDQDVVIARFEPGNETPRGAGWSSPRTFNEAHTSSTALDGFISPSVSPEKSGSHEKHSTFDHPLFPTANHKEEQYDDEVVADLGEMPEFDTMLESEGFSMISVDSVPSLREHLSSPANAEEKQSLDRASNQYPATTPNSERGVKNRSSIGASREPSAYPTLKVQDRSLLSVQNLRVDDSFSSVPPEILEAATPARKSHFSKLQSRENSRRDDSFSSIAPEILEAATPGRELPKAKTLKPDNSQFYEDSFSAIPSAVLDAATPAPAQRTSPKSRSIEESTSTAQLSVPNFTRPSSSIRESAKSASKRLPTPEETPSPPADQIFQLTGSCNRSLGEAPPNHHPSANDSSIYTQLQSSPPSMAPRRYTYTAHIRQKRELHPEVTQTPSIVFSSPGLPPPIQIPRGQAKLAVQTEELQRPGLSPIARAGRALQHAVGPASSPRSRAQSLGSPFKSPVAERRISSSVASSSLSPGHHESTKPQLGSNDMYSSLWNRSVQQDDPFDNTARNRQPPMTLSNKQNYTLGMPEQRRISDTRLSTIKSEGDDSILSDNAMSWQAEEDLTADAAPTSFVNNIDSVPRERSLSIQTSQEGLDPTQTLEQKWAEEREAVRKQIQNANSGRVIIIDSDDEASTDGGHDEDEDDEDFGLLLETLNSSSPAIVQAQALSIETVEKPRRSKIPSPWRKNSRRLVYSDELSHLSSPVASKALPLGKGRAIQDTSEIELSSVDIPHKASLQSKGPENGSLDLSAILTNSSPNKSRPPILKGASQLCTQGPTKPSFSSASSIGEFEDSLSKYRELSFAPIPQNSGFEVRARGSSNGNNAEASSVFGSSPLKPSTYVNNIFGVHSKTGKESHNPTPELSSSSAAEPLGLSSPSRTNTLRVSGEQKPVQVADEDCSYTSSTFSPTTEEEAEIRSIDNRTLKWTETVRLASTQMDPLASPTKSCLRSPVKTPSNGSNSGSNGTNPSPSKNVAFVSSSPIPPSPVAAPLSSTTWSKDHWRVLQAIWYSWRPDFNGGSEEGPRVRRRNSTRVISRLLGRKVFSGENEMRLKQWHLEVVDEFRGEVPGWEEKVIAMRLFSLIVGEEQRNAGLA